MNLSRRIVLLALLIILGLLGLEGFRLVSTSHFERGEEEFVVVGLIAYLIIISGPLAHYTGLPVAAIELSMGVLASYYLVPKTRALDLIAGIGANMVLFMAGAEIDVVLLRKRLRSAVSLGVLSIIGPVIIALGISIYYTPDLLVLTLAALVATSAALTYAILQANGLVRTRTGQTVLAAAMFTDIIGIILLNIATSSANPLLLLYGAIIIIAILIQPLLSRIEGLQFEMEIRLVTMALIVLGAATEFLGIHSVLTSFILGIIVSETLRERRLLREKLEGMAFGFFAPFFFVTSGLMIDPSLLLEELILVLAVGVGVFMFKFIPSYMYLKRKIKSRRAAALYASSLSPLLTVTLIAAQIGLDSGIFDATMYVVIAGSALATSILSSAVSLIMRGRLQYLDRHFF